MAFARLAFRILLIILILLAVIGLMLPSSARVEREILIDAPPSAVFPHLNSMRAFHAWSPWTDGDPETVYRFEGPESGVGSRMRWFSGEEGIGEGSQEITASTVNERVETDLVFGDKGRGTATFLMSPSGQATRLRWQFQTDFGWDLFGRYVGLMLDGMIGMAYDRGLRRLKEAVEDDSDGAVSEAAAGPAARLPS